MENFSFRSATLDDIDAIHQLITKQNILDFGEPLQTVEDIQRIWSGSNFDMKLDSLIAVASDGQVAGYAELRDKEDVYVYLASRDQDVNLAGHLIGLLEDRARSQKTVAKPVELWGRAGYRNQVLINTFDTNGYKSDISFLIMEIVMTEQPQAPTWPDGIVVRTFIVDQDEQATYRADEEAAKDKGYHDPLSYEKWAKRMGMDRKTFDPSIWFIASEKNEIAGVALNVIGKSTPVGWVDHLSVRRTWRNKGIGRALLLQYIRRVFQARHSYCKTQY